MTAVRTAIEPPEDAWRRHARASWLAIGVGFLVAIVTFWRAAAGYFFLFDDFAPIGVAKAQSFAGLFTQSFIGFYRPFGFVVLWIAARLFGWDAPAGYLALSLMLHAVAAACCFGLARTLWLDRLTSALAALLFLLSPWSAEAFLWVSSVYDLVATCGVLASLWCLRLIVTGPSRPIATRVLLGAGACVAAFVAFFSKESAIVLPALAAIWILLAPAAQPPLASRVLWLLPCTVVPTIAYLGVRASMMGLLSGAYGEFGSLWRGADVLHNLWTYARTLALPPLPTEWSTPTVLFRVGCVYPFLGAVAPAAFYRGVVDRPRLIAACGASFLISVAPVLWFGLAPNNTFAGRFSYLPGAWFAIAMAGALGRPRPRTLVDVVALVIACGYFAGSLVHQTQLWGRASAISRSVVGQMEAYRGRTDRALYVTNLPHMSIEGPLLLKAYAFRFYRDGKDMPPVRADIVLVSLAGEGTRVVSPLGPDAFSDYQPPADRPELKVTLDLPPVAPQ